MSHCIVTIGKYLCGERERGKKEVTAGTTGIRIGPLLELPQHWKSKGRKSRGKVGKKGCWTRTTRLRRRSFFTTAPVVWNSLPLHLHSPYISRSQFQAGLKTRLLRLAFHWPFLWYYWRDWTELNCDQIIYDVLVYLLLAMCRNRTYSTPLNCVVDV